MKILLDYKKFIIVDETSQYGPLSVIFDERPLQHNKKIEFKNLDFSNKILQYDERLGDFANNCSLIQNIVALHILILP